MLGAARALEGDIAPALEQMEPSYEATFGYGFLGMLPGIIMADTLAGANRNQEALALVTRLLEGLRTPEEGVFVPELWRIRGELVLRQSAGDAREAERYFGTAVRIAAKQGAMVYRLRAEIPLARMLAEGGRREEAKAVLDHVNAVRLDESDGPETAIAAPCARISARYDRHTLQFGRRHRRGRMTRFLLRCTWSGSGPKCRLLRDSNTSAVEGKADVNSTPPKCRE